MRNQLTLDYVPAAPKHRVRPWMLICLWIASSAVLWRALDWHAYVNQGGIPWPKFEWPLWFQLTASLVLGLLLTASLFAASMATRRLGRHITHRCY